MRRVSIFRIIVVPCALLAVAAQPAWSGSACDLNQDGKTDAGDVELAIGMSIGRVPCAAAINGAGVCDVVTVQRVTNAALGGPCVVGDVAAPRSVTLSWKASITSGVMYNVYRSSAAGGPYAKLNPVPIAESTFTDTTVQPGRTYYYVATAVSGEIESVHSNEAEAVVR